MAMGTAGKLGLHPGETLVVRGRPAASVKGLLDDVEVRVAGRGRGDVTLIFAGSLADVRAAAGAIAEAAATGRCWVAYRKGASRRSSGPDVLHRDTLQAELHRHGLDGVTLVALDPEWSALRVKAVAAG